MSAVEMAAHVESAVRDDLARERGLSTTFGLALLTDRDDARAELEAMRAAVAELRAESIEATRLAGCSHDEGRAYQAALTLSHLARIAGGGVSPDDAPASSTEEESSDE